jgi:hypothetical protein
MSKRSTQEPLAGRNGRKNTNAHANGLREKDSAVPPVNVGTPPRPTIKPESDDSIHVAAGGKFPVPRENIDDDLDDGSDLAGAQAKKVRKPNRHEWIALKRDSEFHTRLLLHKPKGDCIEVEHYYVDEALRSSLIKKELKSTRAFVFYSFKTKSFGIWIVTVTLENSWYESLQQLFSQAPEFFSKNAIRILSDKDDARYRVKYKPMPNPVSWPDKDTGELLGEALGPDRIIRSRDHTIYRDLIEGSDLE